MAYNFILYMHPFIQLSLEYACQILDSKVIHQNLSGHEVSDSYDKLVDESSVLYCERFMEFLIDLLSQLPTRRYDCLIYLVFN